MKALFGILSFGLACSAQAACPDFSGTYERVITIAQPGCDRIVVQAHGATGAETLQFEFRIDASESPRVGNPTWVESLRWEGEALVHTSRYSDAYLAAGVQISESIGTKITYRFTLLQNGDISYEHRIFGVHGQPVEESRWANGILKKTL